MIEINQAYFHLHISCLWSQKDWYRELPLGSLMHSAKTTAKHSLQETKKVFIAVTHKYTIYVIAQSPFVMMAMPQVALHPGSFQ